MFHVCKFFFSENVALVFKTKQDLYRPAKEAAALPCHAMPTCGCFVGALWLPFTTACLSVSLAWVCLGFLNTDASSEVQMASNVAQLTRLLFEAAM